MEVGEKGGLKFSEALFCMRANELDSRKGTSPVLLWMPGRSTYIQDVGFISTETQNRGLTLFERHNYTDDQGKVLGFTSHQARHLLNTEAQRSSLPDDLIARWSGRKRINQNAVYDQRSTQERVEHSRSVVVATAAETDKRSIELESKARRDGPWLIISPRQPRSCSDLDDIEPHLTGLQTQYGECYHDYAVTPCDGFVECLECKDHDCIKGSDQDAQTRLARLELLKRRADAEVEKSRTAVAAGDWGAQDWLKVQRARVSKLEELIAILLDPSVPDGARVRLADTDLPTHLHRMLRGMARQALANRLVPEQVIQQMLVAIDPEATLASTVKVHPRPALAGRVAGEEEAHGT